MSKTILCLFLLLSCMILPAKPVPVLNLAEVVTSAAESGNFQSNYKLTGTVPIALDQITKQPTQYRLRETHKLTLTLTNETGKVYWVKKPANRTVDQVQRPFFISETGTTAILDSTQSRYVLVDKYGKHIFLPQGTAGMNCEGFIGDMYWFFFESFFEEEDYGGDGPYYPLFFKTWCGFLLVKPDGSLYKKVELPNRGYVGNSFISPDCSRIFYDYSSGYDETMQEGMQIVSNSGTVIKSYSMPGFRSVPQFGSAEADFVLLNKARTYKILDINSGDICLEFLADGYASVSGKQTSLVVATQGKKLVVMDIRSGKVVSILTSNLEYAIESIVISSEGQTIWCTSNGIKETFTATGKVGEK